MRLALGTKLGPYEIVAPLGAGGMGEVYRARDTTLARDVAIKVLATFQSHDPDRLRRFEQEARAAAALNHPNILAVFQMGTYEGAPYLVSELLEGGTLREQLVRGPVPVRKAIDYGVQIARGLAAAHDKGIAHRDLKPENLFVTKDGRVKILDFGLAKLTQREAASDQGAATVTAETEPGVVIGTVGYMSPEQVRGKSADHRTDIFAFGVVFYEMLTGKRAFRKPTSAETMSAILNEDPPGISQLAPSIPLALQRIVHRCLEKNPEQRLQSAHDLAFALEQTFDVSTAAQISALEPRKFSFLRGVAVAGLFALIVVLILVWGSTRLSQNPQPKFKQLTFRRGKILTARFASDGQSVIYSAEWDGKPVQIFGVKIGSPGSMNMGFPENADLLAVSPSGELALSVRQVRESEFIYRGVLARSPPMGGAPRELLENVQYADWLPDGKGLAVVRSTRGEYSLEFPLGKTLYKTRGWISHLRVSPDGQSAAFIDHPLYGDDRGLIAVVDSRGHKEGLTPVFTSAWGVAWSPDGQEIWFAAADTGSNRALRAVTLSSKERVLLRIPGSLTLFDVSRSGQALVSRQTERVGMAGLVPGKSSERDLSWFDSSNLADLAADGQTIVFGEYGEGAGPRYIVCLRNTEGPTPVQLGEGVPLELSPNGKWVLSLNTFEAPPRLVLLPTGPGAAKSITTPSIAVESGNWLPDGQHIVVWGSESGQPVRGYLYALKDESLRTLTPPGFVAFEGRAISPDGKWIAVRDKDGRAILFPVEGGSSRSLPAASKENSIGGWSGNGRSIYIYQPWVPVRVFRVDIATGARELWKEITPGDSAGIHTIAPLVTPDGRFYAYSYARYLSDLFVVQGMK